MKFKFKPSHRAALAAQREGIRAAVEGLSAVIEQRAQCREQADRLPAVIEKAEQRVDPDDAKGLASLSQNKTKLGVLEQRTAELEGEAESLALALRGKLSGTAQTVEAVMGEIIPQAERAVVDYLAVVFFDRSLATQHARNADALRPLLHLRAALFPGIVDPVDAGREALRVVDMILSDTIPFPALPAVKSKTQP